MPACAQAGALPLGYNKEQSDRWQSLQAYRAWNKKDIRIKGQAATSLSLPFLDDFSGVHIVPDSSLWQKNSGVFINNRLGAEAPSLGVASFDGIRANGQPYSLNLKSKGPCDTLTSRPINLSAVPANLRGTVYLSYYLQIGHPDITIFRPDTTDSLVVQLLNPASGKWSAAFTHRGGTTKNAFQNQYVAIEDSLLQDGFQFRFLNFGFQNNTYNLWNLDYVYLDADRLAGDSSVADVAFSGILAGFFKGYRTIPLDHYNKTLQNAVADSLVGTIINQGQGTVVFNGLNITADSTGPDGQLSNATLLNAPLATKVLGGISDGGNRFIPKAGRDILTNVKQGKPFAEAGGFRYKMAYIYANTTFNRIVTNDTLSDMAGLTDYYAADDGTGEILEFVVGNFASMVVKVTPLDTGKLTGIALYIDPYSFSTNPTLTARLLVYKKLRGIDGATADEPLYISAVSLASNGGRWYFFPLTRAVAVGAEPYYIGYRQDISDDNRIFIRADINSGQAGVYVNFSGSWQQDPVLVGQPMMRPYYQCVVCPVAVQPRQSIKALTLLPNPQATGQQVRVNGQYLTGYLLAADGRQVALTLKKTEVNTYFDVPSTLPPGVYMLRLFGRTNTGQGRLVVH